MEGDQGGSSGIPRQRTEGSVNEHTDEAWELIVCWGCALLAAVIWTVITW